MSVLSRCLVAVLTLPDFSAGASPGLQARTTITCVFAHTTSRSDVELGARLFRHLLNLPLACFQTRRVGDTIARAGEHPPVSPRQRHHAGPRPRFLGRPHRRDARLQRLPDAHRGRLAAALTGLSLAITPLLRARLDEKVNRGAENQAFLVETINGIDTLKAVAVEPQMTRRWENPQATYVSAGLRTATLGTLAHEAGHCGRRHLQQQGAAQRSGW